MILYKRGSVWHVSYSATPGHRVRRTTGATSRAEAERVAKRIVEQALGQDVTLGALVARYAQVARLEKRSWATERSQLRELVSHLGVDRPLSTITPADVQALKTSLEAARTRRGKRAPATINRHLALLKLLFNRANAWGLYDRANPVSRVKFARESPRLRFLSRDELHRLIEVARVYSAAAPPSSPRYYTYALIVTAVLTGARLGEILRFRWDELQDGFVRITRSKSGRCRHVPIRTELIRLWQTLPPSEYVFQLRHSPDVIASAWRRICAKARIRDARFHDLRHTAATLMIQGGADPVSVQAILGHSSLAMTQVYAHASRESVERAIAALPMLVDQETKA